MKKYLSCVVVASAMLFFVGCGQKSYFGKHDVVNSDFGDSYAEVHEVAEGTSFVEDEGRELSNATFFMGYEATVKYVFVNDKLAMVDFKIYPDEDTTVEELYGKVKEEMVKTYGESKTDFDNSFVMESEDRIVWANLKDDHVFLEFTLSQEKYKELLE